MDKIKDVPCTFMVHFKGVNGQLRNVVTEITGKEKIVVHKQEIRLNIEKSERNGSVSE